MKVDPASITHSIYELFESPYYNMLASYHSRYYGWSYMVINFIILSPFELIFGITHHNHPEVINFTIRAILFAISLFAVLVFYTVCLKLTRYRTISFFAALLFMVTPITSTFWHTIHPEAAGILFFLLGALYFLHFRESRERKDYIFCLVFLVLSSLSKQPFFVVSLFVLLAMLLASVISAAGSSGNFSKNGDNAIFMLSNRTDQYSISLF